MYCCSLLYSKYFQLEKVAWHLNLQAAQGSKSKLAEPNAIFQFGLKDDSRQRNANSNLVLEFNHNELLMFYNKVSRLTFH